MTMSFQVLFIERNMKSNRELEINIEI